MDGAPWSGRRKVPQALEVATGPDAPGSGPRELEPSCCSEVQVLLSNKSVKVTGATAL